MSGTVEGGKKCAAKNKEKYGDDFYVKIGREGGKNGRTGGFYYMKNTGQTERIREAGRKGGKARHSG